MVVVLAATRQAQRSSRCAFAAQATFDWAGEPLIVDVESAATGRGHSNSRKAKNRFLSVATTTSTSLEVTRVLKRLSNGGCLVLNICCDGDPRNAAPSAQHFRVCASSNLRYVVSENTLALPSVRACVRLRNCNPINLSFRLRQCALWGRLQVDKAKDQSSTHLSWDAKVRILARPLFKPFHPFVAINLVWRAWHSCIRPRVDNACAWQDHVEQICHTGSQNRGTVAGFGCVPAWKTGTAHCPLERAVRCSRG